MPEKHDLCSRTLRLLPEERAEYNDMRDRYARDLQPAGDVEQTLVDEICFNYWRLQQARAAELTIIDRHPTALPIISLYIRYRTGYERAFYKGLDQIQKRQSDRRKQAAQSDPAPPRADRPRVRSAESPSQPLPPITEPAAKPEEVRFENLIAPIAAALMEELDDHHLENRVRSELCLSPLPIPIELSKKINDFVSRNPAAVPDRLLELMRKAA
jgi:hypothetical protein